ncbi:MAG TPA: MFS transporter [Candidatus Bathyarchaeia archaeon]|nr:MFS transporter [Candidatus Bathyarchaeia archaeon]
MEELALKNRVSESEILRAVGRSVFFTGFSFFFIDFYIQILGVALGASALEIGSFTAIVFVAQVFSNPLAGYLADRLGRRATLAFGGFSRVISLVLVGVAFDLSSGTLITLGRLVQGIAAGFFWTSSFAVVADETEAGGRSQEFGRITLWVNRGMLVGALGGYALLLLRLDAPPYFFAFAAVVSGVFALGIHPKLMDSNLLASKAIRPDYGQVLNRKSASAGLAIINAVNPAGVLVMSSFLIVYVTQTVFPASEPVSARALYIAIASAPQVVLSAFFSPMLARFADRHGRFVPLMISMVATIPVTFGLIYITQLWQLAILGFMLALTGIVFGAAFNALVGDLYRDSRGSAYGGLNMFNSIGAALGSTLGGILYPMGWAIVIGASTFIQALSLSGLFMIRKAYRTIPLVEVPLPLGSSLTGQPGTGD